MNCFAVFKIFSWDEFALYDLPATVDYVLNATGMTSLGYVGHSQGTLVGFAGFSVNQQLADKVNIFIALGPVSTVKNMTSPIKYIAPFAKDVEVISYLIVSCFVFKQKYLADTLIEVNQP